MKLNEDISRIGANDGALVARLTPSSQEEGNRARSLCLLSLTVAAVLLTSLFFASAAIGEETHAYTGTSFGPAGTADSLAFGSLQSLAVDQPSGNVYAYDAEAGKIYKFDASGEPANFTATGSNAIEAVTGSGNGENQIAVAPAGSPAGTAGDIYLAAYGRPVSVYSPSGTKLGELAGAQACGVAVNPAGHVFIGTYPATVSEYIPSTNPVADSDQSAVSTASLSGTCNVAADGLGNVYPTTYSGGVVKLEGIEAASSVPVDPSATTVAVDPATNQLYANRNSEVAQYDSAGALISTFGANLLSRSYGVAINPTLGRIYVGNAGRVDVFGPLVTLPNATTGEATEITNTSAQLNGTINPDETVASFQFEYGVTADYGEVAPATPAPVGNDNSSHAVEVEISSLLPNTTYHFRVKGINSDGANPGADKTFRTPGPADAETTGSLVRTATTALLEGRVNPQGKPTSYYFEYGTVGPCSSAVCVKTDAIAIGEGEEIILVAHRANDLMPGTTYHYRVVADNANTAGLSIGGDMTVTTRTSDAELTHGALAGPPGSDRAWEQVNAPDTGGHSVNEIKAISNDGERVIYNVKGGTPETTFGSIYTPLFAERHSNGWNTRGILPPQKAEPGKEEGWSKVGASGDLSSLVGEQTRSNFQALWRLSPGGQSTRIFATSLNSGEIAYTVSDDGSRIVARPGGTGENLYDITSGAAELISFLPDETVPSCGVQAGESPIAFGLPKAPQAAAHWVSADGSLAFFPSKGNECGGESQLYVRDIEAGVTKRVSLSPVSGPECGAEFIKSTADAAYFWTSSRLSTGDPFTPKRPCGLKGGDVYRYDLSAETVECLTCLSSKPAEVESNLTSEAGGFSTVAVADDESRIYFVSTAQLTAGAAVPGIYRLRTDSGDLRYIAPAESFTSFGNVGGAAYAGEALAANGSTMVFRSSQAGLNPIDGLNNGGTLQYYLYDDENRALTCASCSQNGAPTAGSVFVSEAEGGGLLTAVENTAIGPNLTPLSSNGQVFAFATPTSLVEQDQNEAKAGENPVAGSDAYEWRDGRLLLISDGTSNWLGNAGPSSPKIAGISGSGKDVYFTAAVRLTPDALESAPRLYDARIGGGFSFPEAPPPCPLEVCQGTPGSTPAQPAPGSSSFQGPANPRTSKSKCPKGKRSVKSRGKVRCVKNKAPKKKRGANRASHNRRTSR